MLEYAQWRRFSETIDRAKESCINSKYRVSDHFTDVGKIIKTGAFERKIEDYCLSRYACYLIVQNGDSRKEVIALGQTYFLLKQESKNY